MGFFSKLKDKATAVLLKNVANSFISEFGTLDQINVDSNNKSIYLSVNLKGEKESIKIEITDYRVVKSEHNNFIQLQNIKTSREWLNIALSKYYLDRQIEIPSQFISIVKFLL